MSLNKERIERVLSSMQKDGLYQFIITDPQSIYYLTGINIHPGVRFFGLYLNQKKECHLVNNALFPLKNQDVNIIWYSDTESAITKLDNVIKKDEVLGVDKYMASRFLLELIELKSAKSFVNGSAHIDYVRMQKDAKEQELMINVSKLNDKAMGIIIEKIKIGMSELEVIDILKGIYKEVGAEDFSFSPIIAYQANAANPHHSSNNTKLKEGDCVIIDIGCIKDEYCSDMTRTIFFGEPNEKAKEVYNIVREANERAINGVKPGVKFSDIDALARGYITEKGYGEYFTHRTGHCIGMSVHEYGDVSAIHNAELKEGMIFSIEPGIYIAGEVGVRIEDLILVTKDGHKNLNSFTKDIIVK